MIFGICGALRCIEFINLKFNQVEDKTDKFIVSVEDTKTYIDRSFVIGSLFYEKIKKYILLRPQEQFTNRFFIRYNNGKCDKQVMGKNKIGSTPSSIASYLGLKDPSKYTGHCFRRTSATLLSNSGANMPMLKQLGGWKSDTVAAGYIASSERNKDLIFQGIVHENKTKKMDSLLAVPSLNTKDSAKDSAEETDVIADLGLTYEDFCDDDSDFHNQNILPDQPLNINFRNAKGQSLSSTCLAKSQNATDVTSKLFTSKSPVKLTFVQPNKKVKLTNLSASESNGDYTLLQPSTSKDSSVKFENCTINGNIINNYYYCSQKHETN